MQTCGEPVPRPGEKSYAPLQQYKDQHTYTNLLCKLHVVSALACESKSTSSTNSASGILDREPLPGKYVSQTSDKTWSQKWQETP